MKKPSPISAETRANNLSRKLNRAVRPDALIPSAQSVITRDFAVPAMSSIVLPVKRSFSSYLERAERIFSGFERQAAQWSDVCSNRRKIWGAAIKFDLVQAYQGCPTSGHKDSGHRTRCISFNLDRAAVHTS